MAKIAEILLVWPCLLENGNAELFFFFDTKLANTNRQAKKKKNNSAHREETTGLNQSNQLEQYSAIP